MKKTHLRRYLIAGLLVWVPIMVTLLVIRFIIGILDSTMNLLPEAYQPDTLLGVHIPGLGILISLIIVFITGIAVTNYFGHRIVGFGESILDRIPLVRSIYKAVKQVLTTIFSSGSKSFRKVLLVEYPRKGLWSIAFQTGTSNDEVKQKSGQDLITVFIPTTPNPTSGFLILVPLADAIELEMSVDEALKMVISLGVVQPEKIGEQLTAV